MKSLATFLYKRMFGYGDQIALSCNGREISYFELINKSISVAQDLINCGAHQENIGIVGQRVPSSYFGILGILFSGCSYVPINPKYNKEKILSVLKDAKIKYLVGDNKSIDLLGPVLLNHTALKIKAIVRTEEDKPSDKRLLDKPLSLSSVNLERPIDVGGENLAYVLYTSGSTGIPKGVQVTNNNLLAFLKNMESIYKLDIGFRASQVFDFSFDPSASDMFFTWANGGVLCILPEEEIFLPFDYIIRERISFWNSVPTIVNFMAKLGLLKPGIFPEIKHSMFCGEQFSQQIANNWSIAAPNSTIENLYGPTEATIYISRYLYQPIEDNQIYRNSIIPIGYPFPGHQFAVINDDNKPILNGEVGEIIFKGPQISNGYLNNQEKTLQAFVSFDWDLTGEKWYRSGDLGFFNKEGSLECVGRKDNQIKIAGRRIEIGEIESVLSRYISISNLVVVPIRDKNEIAIGIVAFTTEILSKERESQIRGDSEKYLDRIFFPRKIINIKSFPLTSSGKIDRKNLSIIASNSI